jgi:hypothetical protein
MRRLVRLELFQWYGLLGAAIAWTSQLVLGFGVTVARCSTGGDFGLAVDTWEIVLIVVAGSFALLGEAAAISVFLATRALEHDDPPPDGRRHFFASAAVIGNVLFLMIILLSGIGIIAQTPCHQS